MDVNSFFATVEKALFDLATWVILIPKTLYRVLAHPEAVPDYVRGELSAERTERFDGSLSPVFLYLFLALGPFLLTKLVDPPGTPLEGKVVGIVDSAYTFSLGLSAKYPEQVRVQWSINDTIMPDLARCYQVTGSGFATDGEDSELALSIACHEQLFQVLLLGHDFPMETARDSVAAVYGYAVADQFASYWCSPPPYQGCLGHEAWSLFEELAWQPVGVVRDSVAAGFGEDTAAEIAAYWCASPADDGCEDSVERAAWDRFEDLVLNKGHTVRAAVSAMSSGRFSSQGLLLRVMEAYWCDRLNPGCEESELPVEAEPSEQPQVLVYEDAAAAQEEFMRLVTEEDYGVDVALSALVNASGPGPLIDAAVFWCASPAGSGCEGSSVETAWTEFRSLVEDQDFLADEAEPLIAEAYGATLAGGILAYWCAPPADVGCGNVTGMTDESADRDLATETNSQLAPDMSVQCDGLANDDLYQSTGKDVVTCTWHTAATYSITASVFTVDGSELIDISREHIISITTPADSAARAGKDRAATTNVPKPKPADLLKDSKTMLMALALLAFPLVLALLTVVFRVPELTQAAIKPSFYIQCLYLSPFALAIWLPVLLSGYWPEFFSPGADLFFWTMLLIVALGIWLPSVEINFIAAERQISKRKAAAILAAPFMLAVLILASAAFAGAGISKFDAIEHAGYILIVLLALPLVARHAGRIYRNLSGRGRTAA